MKVQIACPNCCSSISITVNGDAVQTPLVCPVCAQLFFPRFYCPDARASARHVFAATRLLVDNAGALYAFCPEHTFTTYALAPDSKPRPKPSPLRALARVLDSLAFRLALMIEGWRWRTFSRR